METCASNSRLSKQVKALAEEHLLQLAFIQGERHTPQRNSIFLAQDFYSKNSNAYC